MTLPKFMVLAQKHSKKWFVVSEDGSLRVLTPNKTTGCVLPFQYSGIFNEISLVSELPKMAGFAAYIDPSMSCQVNSLASSWAGIEIRGPVAFVWDELPKMENMWEEVVPDTTCAICQEPVRDKAFTLPCYHCFHKKCLQNWCGMQRRKGEPTTCPLCRHNIGDMMLEVLLPVPMFSSLGFRVSIANGTVSVYIGKRPADIGPNFLNLFRDMCQQLARQIYANETAIDPTSLALVDFSLPDMPTTDDTSTGKYLFESRERYLDVMIKFAAQLPRDSILCIFQDDNGASSNFVLRNITLKDGECQPVIHMRLRGMTIEQVVNADVQQT